MTERLHTLRLAAARKLADNSDALRESDGTVRSDRVKDLVESLQIYQAELEVQNEELRESKLSTDLALARYAELFSAMPLPALVVDRRLVIHQCNRAAAQQLGKGGLLPPRTTFIRLSASKDLTRLYEFVQRAVPGDQLTLPSQALKSLQGEPFPADMHVIVLPSSFDGDGQVLILVVSRAAEAALSWASAIHEAVFDSVASQIAVIDHEGTIEAVNAAWRQFARSKRSVPGTLLAEAGPGANYLQACADADPRNDPDASQALAGVRSVLARDQAEFRMTYPCMLDDQMHWFLLSVTPIEPPIGSAQRGGAVICHADITDQKLAEEQLEIAAAFDAQEGIFICDASLRITRVNQAFCRISGFMEKEVLGKRLVDFVASRHHPEEITRIAQAVTRTGAWRGELWCCRRDGEDYLESLTLARVTDRHGNHAHVVGTVVDITELKRAEEEIHTLAFYDPLTKLANRRLFRDRLDHALAKARRTRQQCAVLFLDLDNFKDLNDTQGHDAGDRLLCAISERLRLIVREGDTIARLGGDEFVLLLESLTPETIEQDLLVVAEKVATVVSEAAHGNAAQSASHVSASIGLALSGEPPLSSDELLRHADLAMYEAKRAGRNAIRFYSSEFQATFAKRVSLQAQLREAVTQQQMTLHYQVQVAPNGRPTGAEALVRWLHPTQGMLAPSEFIPLAEESGLILPLGRWVLRSACEVLARWQADPILSRLTLAVNVSTRQMEAAGFVEEILATIDDAGAPRHRLKLEVTESVVLSDPDAAITMLEQLRQAGVALSMDDFGTGYSSLSYLRYLPLSQIKLDQSFVREITTDRKSAAVARSLIGLAREMDFCVIAEGVEAPPQAEFLSDLGCHAFQGFLFGPPEPLEHFEARCRLHLWGGASPHLD